MKAAQVTKSTIQAVVLAASMTLLPISVSAQDSTASMTPISQQADKLSGLDIGERVYVRGFFADELVVIQRIDASSNRVKVMRSGDGTSKWVSASDIISREESAVNDAARVVGAIALLACLMDIEACEKAVSN